MHYPAPLFDTIVEPFAGSAGYSMRYPDRNVVLVERDPKIAATWRFLLQATERDVLALPDLAHRQSVDDLSVCQEARWLIGWYCGRGMASPRKTQSVWIDNFLAGRYGNQSSPCIAWGPAVRERIASQIGRIRHWTLIEGDYEQAPAVEATWFVDPPYQVAGKYYRFGSSLLNYEVLGEWCRSRRGQVIVCENVGASWLPFVPWRDIKASESKQCGKVSREAIWVRECDRSGDAS